TGPQEQLACNKHRARGVGKLSCALADYGVKDSRKDMVNQTPRNPSSASDEDAFDAAQSREPADRSGEPDSASRKRLALKKPAAQDEPEGTREPRRGVRSRF